VVKKEAQKVVTSDETSAGFEVPEEKESNTSGI
jgi:hypothetical protein